MIRVIKRYESRKLYDTEESRYVSLEDIAQWVREGQEVRVTDNATSADVSAQVLTQIILDEGKKGSSFLPTELLHELVRAGEKALTDGVGQVQGKMSRIVQSSIDRLGPVRRAREEMGQLRDRLSQLERALDELDQGEAPAAASAAAKPAPRKRRSATKTASTSQASKPKASKPKASAKAASVKLVEASVADDKPAAKTTRRRTAASAKKTTPTADAGTAKPAAAKTTRRKTAAPKTSTKKATAAAKTASADS